MRLGLQRVGNAGGGSASHGRRIVSISTSLTLTAAGFPEGNPAHIRTVSSYKSARICTTLRLPTHRYHPRS
jgi:hypothetical protein